MKIYKTSTFILCLILSACQAKPKYLYEGQQRPRKEAAIVSVIGLYPERKLSLTVKRIDGRGYLEPLKFILILAPISLRYTFFMMLLKQKVERP